MEREDQIVVYEMIKTMVLYGIVLQVICLIVPGNRLSMTVGLWIGVVSGIAMLMDMHSSLWIALDMEPDKAKRYMQQSYAKRYAVVVIVFMAAAYFDVANIVTLILGVMGLKFSAYLQPIMHKLFQK